MKQRQHAGPDPDRRSQSRKRKLANEDDETDGGQDEETSPKKQRLSRARDSSKLRTQHNPDGDSSLPTPQVTGDEEDIQLGKDAIDEDNLDDELEADLFAEFEAAGMSQKRARRQVTDCFSLAQSGRASGKVV